MGEMTWTEFVLPDGRQHDTVFIDTPDDVAVIAAVLRTRGFTFTLEQLRTGDAVFYITHDNLGQDADMVLISAHDRVHVKPADLNERIWGMIRNFKPDDFFAQQNDEGGDDAVQDADASGES